MRLDNLRLDNSIAMNQSLDVRTWCYDQFRADFKPAQSPASPVGVVTLSGFFIYPAILFDTDHSAKERFDVAGGRRFGAGATVKTKSRGSPLILPFNGEVGGVMPYFALLFLSIGDRPMSIMCAIRRYSM